MPRLHHLNLLPVVLALSLMHVTDGEARPTVGMRFGFNTCAMVGADVSKPKASIKPGFAIGGFIRKTFWGTADLQCEVLLSIKGVKREFTGSIPFGTIAFSETDRLTYVEVPVLMRLPFPMEEGSSKLAVFIGPYGALALGSKAHGSYRLIGSSRLADSTFEGEIGNLHRLDYGIVFGGEVALPIGGRMKPALEVRYTWGLAKLYGDEPRSTQIAKDDIPIVNERTWQGLNMRNSVLSVSLILQIPQ